MWVHVTHPFSLSMWGINMLYLFRARADQSVETFELRNQLNACSVENVRLKRLLGRETPPAAPASSGGKKGG